ncbi:MAG: glycosyltransferase family 2 protein [Flavobacteriaceae bacterium]|nr:glycosyltransferase family 2 protein [Bacteroidia bacterium]NNL62046.1 glycosyltransferase family 2 protein [Flavobacteriaceae bacterium]
MSIKASIIISTYNQPAWLEKVLWSYDCQTISDIEILIADDGSTSETKAVIDVFRNKTKLDVQHVWHEDNGFQKTIILNKAIIACKSDYLILTDGDCIARKDFVATHLKYREKGFFLSGGYFKLPLDISDKITKDDIRSQNCFDISWLKANGLNSSFKNNKLTAGPIKAKLLNALTPSNASWNGHNSSGWKQDLIEVNGFDERMQYGGEDRELGERLFNKGLKSKQIRYSAICVHLDHERGYVKPEMIETNKKIRETTKKDSRTWTDFGLIKP